MIRVQVLSQRGDPPQQTVSALFGPEGGTIGRSRGNTLVLDDPDRTVSRTQARILHRDGRYFIVDQGSNPLICNGQPLEDRGEAELLGGERLLVGNFELEVAAVPANSRDAMSETLAATAPESVDDPFADLLGGLAPSAPAVAPRAHAAPSPAATLPFDDDLLGALPSGRPGGTDDPFGAAATGPIGLPPDDFSDLGLPAAASPVAHAQRIDELFGGMAGSIGGDPLALSPLADPLLQPNTASARDDPLAALGKAPSGGLAPRSDHTPIGEFGFNPPAARPSPDRVRFDDETGLPIPGPQDAATIADAPPRRTAPDHGPATSVRSAVTMEAADPFTGLRVPAPAVPADRVARAEAGAHATAPPRADAAPAPTLASSSSVASAPAAAAGDGDPLLAALLRGLGSMHQSPSTLTPALMERIGVLLRGATEGTLQLLLTRQELKREVRAEVTMIAAQANNPLKFSPTVDVALGHLLGPGMRGFMPAEAAMRDAFNDLRAHQFGVMVGMRAALARLIERFGPDELEKRIAAKSALDSLFAANRKAKLWDQFVVLYSSIASEAEDDFHALFGKAFLEAYEAQMAQLRSHGSD